MTACEPLCSPIAGGAESLPLPEALARFWAAVPPFRRNAYSGHLPPPNRFARDERKSRRKPWRFCCAWAVTSARSAGGFRGWSWRCSDQPDLRLALFFLKSRLNPRCDRLSGGADAIRRGF